MSGSVGTTVVRASARSALDSISLVFVDPVDTSQVITGTRQLHIWSSRTQLKADNSDTATITALLIDDNNNPSVGDTVFFSCNIGVIGQSAIVDGSGKARVTLHSMPVNGTCIVKATSSKSKDTASTVVIFSGVKVTLEADVTELKINNQATITALLTDGSGNPIGGDEVVFTTSGGLFANNGTTYRGQLDPGGRATVKVTSASAGTIKVYGTSLNTDDSISIVFSNNALTLTATSTNILVGGTAFTTITALYVNGSGNPLSGETVTFSTNAGTISTASVVTDGAGMAQTTLLSALFTGTATVVASTAGGSNQIKITFSSLIPNKIKLTISPDNISVNGGVAVLTAKVTDINDNMVSGANVNFRLLKGPGGGEYIDKPVATTQSGIAHAQLFAGSIPSMYRNCLVQVTVESLIDSSKLTISGEPYAISVARPQSDTVVVPNAGQMNDATFDYNTGAVVVDINGNPVADGTRVNFSVVVSGMAVHPKYFVRWEGLGSPGEKKALCAYGFKDIPFEDINNNFSMDENIDLKLDLDDTKAARGDDVNGNGVCDFNPVIHDLWVDFNGSGTADAAAVAAPFGSVYINQGCEPYYWVDATTFIFADLYPDGVWNSSELVRDVGTLNSYDTPLSGSKDRRWWEYECLPYWFGVRFDFDKNDYGVAITTSAVCVNGVADVHVTYPRQLARRLIVTVNAEANGVRDRFGERFTLPVIVGSK